MLKIVRDFYESTKIREFPQGAAAGPAPVTHTKVFYKRYPRLPRTKLPSARIEGQFADLLAQRVSSRGYAAGPVTLDQLAQVLSACRIVDPSREPERRTYPSGGARFPIEIYPVAFNVEGLEPGCYHYDIAGEALETLWKKDLRERAREIVSPHVTGCAVALVMTAVMARSEVKYGQRAYPLCLLEAGHIGQSLSLACTQLGLGHCPILGFVNDTLTKILDLTESEIPVYVMAVGRLPG